MAIIKFNDKEVEIAGIIFDKDGTLIDFGSFWRIMMEERINNILEHPYIKIKQLEGTLKEFLPSFYGLTKDFQIRPDSILAQGGYQDGILAIASVIYQHGIEWNKAKEIVENAFQLADAKINYAKYFKPLPYATEIIETLVNAGVKIGVASMDTIDRSRYCLKLLNVDYFIPYIIGPEKVKNSKPHPEFIHVLCKEMQLLPSDIAIVGDGINDIIMGKRAGVKLNVGITTGVESKERLQRVADVVLDSLKEITVIKSGDSQGIEHTQNHFALIYIDGASQGNPGLASIGVVIKNRLGETIQEISRFIGNHTNNFAEYTALVVALETALKNGYKSIEVRSDSELVVKQIKGEYKVKQPALKNMFIHVNKLLTNFPSWTINHINREQNKRADELAELVIRNRATL